MAAARRSSREGQGACQEIQHPADQSARELFNLSSLTPQCLIEIITTISRLSERRFVTDLGKMGVGNSGEALKSWPTPKSSASSFTANFPRSTRPRPTHPGSIQQAAETF